MGRGGFGFMGEKNKLVNRNGNENQKQKGAIIAASAVGTRAPAVYLVPS